MQPTSRKEINPETARAGFMWT